MKAIQKGFTLIELMIVVAIVGILAAIALPAYQDYMVRARMSEPMAKLDELKLGIAEFVASNNQIPTTGTQAGLGGNGAVAAGSANVSANGTVVPTAEFYNAVGFDGTGAGNNPPTVSIGVRLNGAANAALNNVWVHMLGTIDSPGTSAVLWVCRVDTTNSTNAAAANRFIPSSCRTQLAFTPS